MYFLLFVTAILSCQKLSQCSCQGSLFRLEKEDTSLTNDVSLISSTTTDSETACYMKCLNNHYCCFLQIKKIDGFICSLFDFIDIKSVTMKTEKESNIFGVVDQQKKCVAKDCLEWFQLGFKSDGVYNINVNEKVAKVFCDMTTNGGGWTVFQKRINGAVDFQRTWDEYKTGFGDVEGEYWLGNELIHQITNTTSNNILIRIDATDFQDIHKYIIFKGFWIENETNKYKLHTGVFEGGFETLGSDWLYIDNMFFTTKDRDNDDVHNMNCARHFGGGWWHRSCFYMNPNNFFSQTEQVEFGKGLSWNAWKDSLSKALKTYRMSMKQV